MLSKADLGLETVIVEAIQDEEVANPEAVATTNETAAVVEEQQPQPAAI